MSIPADPIWVAIREDAEASARNEPMLASFLYAVILNHKSVEDALSFHLAGKLESHALTAITLRELIDEAFRAEPAIGESVRADLQAVVERDPACRGISIPLLYFKGFLALQVYRIANYYWRHDRYQLALFLQSRSSEVFAVDIHPAARIGHGVLMDHATGIVIGETATVANNVSMLHGVTLGGTGKHGGDRHPKVNEGVLISAGAKLFGNIRIGTGAKVGGGAVVLNDVQPHTTVVGIPAVPVGHTRVAEPAREMDHRIEQDFDYQI